MLAGVIGLIVVRGPTPGQSGLIGNVVRHYIEETSAFVNTAADAAPLADISALVTYSAGQDGRDGTERSVQLATVQEISLQASEPASTDYLDSFRSNKVTEYVVQSGDNISFIASDYGVSVNSILWANGLNDANNLSPGQVIRIPPVTGVIHTVQKGDTLDAIAKRYEAEKDRVIAFNDLTDNEPLKIGDELVIPDGHIITAVKWEEKSRTKKAGLVKPFSYLPDLGDYLGNPALGFNWGVIHGRNGVDVASTCGTPVYAAAGGNVTIALNAGYNGGFGKFVKIVHPNETETLYAHLTKVNIEAGTYVNKGELIGLMGTTGHSTGCHLHFEVHGARNPLAKY